jgi:hypothetical protein
VVVEIVFGVKKERFSGLLAAEELLGERRAIVGDVGLLPDQRDAAVGVPLSELLGSLAGGKATPDQKVLCERQASPRFALSDLVPKRRSDPSGTML